MSEKKTNITVQKVAKNYDKGLAVFGGLAIGKMMSHFLDKAITSPSVSGLLGIEVSQNLKKYVKPLIVTGTGLTAFAVAKNSHIKYAGIGCAGIGVNDLVNTVTGKDYLAGIEGGDTFENQDNFEMIDIESGERIPPAPMLELPDLDGLASDVADDDYEEQYAEEVINDYDNSDLNIELDA